MIDMHLARIKIPASLLIMWQLWTHPDVSSHHFEQHELPLKTPKNHALLACGDGEPGGLQVHAGP